MNVRFLQPHQTEEAIRETPASAWFGVIRSVG
ncbi:hypothetical protein dsmv_1847 [Desulfococcus multivorans DSM 2059]|uniref:Uncharacterized protein n=1 Tax=Desulfococcus multivorans DSM 2059 TaxID=1121405 RepID=S7VBL0_DESML|nr:hypothetical protein dsmv_1847 [Desulfococcus multivorans DSM 2059]